MSDRLLGHHSGSAGRFCRWAGRLSRSAVRLSRSAGGHSRSARRFCRSAGGHSRSAGCFCRSAGVHSRSAGRFCRSAGGLSMSAGCPVCLVTCCLANAKRLGCWQRGKTRHKRWAARHPEECGEIDGVKGYRRTRTTLFTCCERNDCCIKPLVSYEILRWTPWSEKAQCTAQELLKVNMLHCVKDRDRETHRV